MAKFWRQIIKSEKGQALPIVLVLLVIGGLIIAPSLNYASTSLKAGQVVKENVRGIYAADAGIEHVLWHLKKFEEPPEALPVNINGMEVVMGADDLGNFALSLGGFEETGGHYEYLTVEGDMVWVEEEEAYLYTITINLQVPDTIKLGDVGVRLPVGYEYELGSAADFAGNLSTGEPTTDTLDRDGAHMLVWGFGPPYPGVGSSEPVATQEFYFTGEGELEGDYTWTKTRETDIGMVSELVGTLYRVTATATSSESSETTAEVTSDVLLMEYGATADTHIIFWQVNPE
ncbi:hypothetical protein ACFLWD_01265 [Chloroflexota bacterium]